MFLSLLVVPVIYFMMTNLMERLGFGQKAAIKVDTEYVEIEGKGDFQIKSNECETKSGQ